MCNGQPIRDEEGNNPLTGRPYPGQMTSVVTPIERSAKRRRRKPGLITQQSELDPIIPGGSMSTSSSGFSTTTPKQTNKSKLTASDNFQG